MRRPDVVESLAVRGAAAHGPALGAPRRESQALAVGGPGQIARLAEARLLELRRSAVLHARESPLSAADDLATAGVHHGFVRRAAGAGEERQLASVGTEAQAAD